MPQNPSGKYAPATTTFQHSIGMDQTAFTGNGEPHFTKEQLCMQEDGQSDRGAAEVSTIDLVERNSWPASNFAAGNGHLLSRYSHPIIQPQVTLVFRAGVKLPADTSAEEAQS